MSEVDIAALAADAQETAEETSEVTLNEIMELGKKQLELQQEVLQAEEALKQKKAELRRISSVDLPERMAAAGMEMFKLKTGQTVQMVNHVAVNIKAADRPAAYAWFNEHGYGALVKTKVALEFGKGEDDAAKELLALLDEKGYQASAKQDIHAQTLKKFGKDIMEEGRVDEMPDFIRIDSFPEAVIK